MSVRSVGKRTSVELIRVTAAALVAWFAVEGFTPSPVIPVDGDRPTIGHGSTFYEDGRPVAMSDPAITPARAAALALALMEQDAERFARTLPGVELTQAEFDLYRDFVGQYGIGTWTGSRMRQRLLEGDYRGACDALLSYRHMTSAAPQGAGWERYTTAGGSARWRFDCSTPGNRVCRGVWTRQQQRHQLCISEAAEQEAQQ